MNDSRREWWQREGERGTYSLLLQSPCTRSSVLDLARTRTHDSNRFDISDGSQPLNHALETKASNNSFLASPTEHPPLSRQILFKLPSAPNAPRLTAITLAPLRPAAQFHIRRPNRGIKNSTGLCLELWCRVLPSTSFCRGSPQPSPTPKAQTTSPMAARPGDTLCLGRDTFKLDARFNWGFGWCKFARF